MAEQVVVESTTCTATEEIELNFRLDEHGRTTAYPTPSLSLQQDDDNNNDKNDNNQKNTKQTIMDYTSKSVQTSLDSISQEILDDLLFDCEITDCALMPRTFWIPCDDDNNNMKPRCRLEQLALDIFHYHVPKNLHYDKSKSGAEWWAQIRPSPEKTGRYSMLMQQNNESNNDSMDMAKEGISFHWDKDEDLRILTGGTTYIHPHLSTVTYLTSIGAPTLAINYRVHNLTGEWIIPGRSSSNDNNHNTAMHSSPPDNNNNNNDNDSSNIQAFISWPKTGKHLSFDGRYLHAAPPDLMQPGEFQKQCQIPKKQQSLSVETIESTKNNVKTFEKILKRRHRRVTFLVNIWLNYHPFNVQPFPETMIDKLSNGKNNDTKKDISITFETNDNNNNNEAKTIKISNEKCHYDTTVMTWPLGDVNCDEILKAPMPVSAIQEEATKGGSIKIQWDNNNNNDESCVPILAREPKKAAATESSSSSSGTKRSIQQQEQQQDVEATNVNKRSCIPTDDD